MVLAGLQIHKDLTCNDFQNQTVGFLTTVTIVDALSNVTAIALEILRPELVSLH